MEVFRIIVNIKTGEVHECTATTIEIEPGRLAVRDTLGNYRDVEAETLHSGDTFVSSGWLPDLASARAEAAAELERRAAQLLDAASKCSGEVASNV